MKRNRLLWEEKKRQRREDAMDRYLEKQREKKEALRLKEERRYEQWAVKVGLSPSEHEPADQPKRRMSRLEKAASG